MELCQERFRLDIWKRFCLQKVAGYWNSSPGKWSCLPDWQSSQSVWTILSGTQRNCSVQGQKLVLPNLRYSMILCQHSWQNRQSLEQRGGSARRVKPCRESTADTPAPQPCNPSSWHDCSHISSRSFARHCDQGVIQCSCQGPWVLIPSDYSRFPCNSCISQMIWQKESLKGESSLQFRALA